MTVFTLPEALPLTGRQQQVLDFILEFQRTRRTSPTRREISDALGLSNPSLAQWFVRAIARRGHLELDEEGRILMPRRDG